MSEKVLDAHGRWRNITVAFRVSPEEDELSRLNPGDQLSDELTEALSMIGRIMAGMKEAS